MLERARLDLERTKVTAPVSGMVVAEMVEQDSFVSKGTPLVTIEDTSAAEIRVSLQMDEVSRIWSDSRRVMNGSPYGFPSTPATVIYQIGERRYRWHGVLKRQEGKGIDERTRTLPCRVLVSDPTKVEALDRYGAALPDLPAGTPLSLLRGMFVDVSVSVKTDLSLVSTPCEALRPNGDVWVVRNNALSILRPPLVHVAAGRAVFESTRDGLLPDDRVIISQLSNVREGMAVAEVASERSPVKTAQAPQAASPDVTTPQPRE
jgi:pyruvate/2-oxoglutarate dehydrogenase complex dihydrolipoamide acyltransferase (E2) component